MPLPLRCKEPVSDVHAYGNGSPIRSTNLLGLAGPSTALNDDKAVVP